MSTCQLKRLFMLDFSNNNYDSENNEEPFSEAFILWEDTISKGLAPGYFDPDDLCDIIDTYFSLDKVDEGRFVIQHAIKLHPDNEDMLYDILQIVNDYELWDDLLNLCERYKSLNQVWTDGYHLTALLQLGMEENAFSLFSKSKKKYAAHKEDLSIIYQAMAESLYQIDLYEAAIDVIKEILPKLNLKENIDLLWIQLQSYLAINDIEKVIELCNQIQLLNPMNAETWSRLGLIYKEIGEKEKSIDAFEFAASLGKKAPVDMLNLIYSYKENGNYNKALEKADEYLEIYPDNYIINLLASNICMEIEEWDKALLYIEKAISLDPSSSFLYLYKCKCLIKLGEYNKAINVLEKGIRNAKDSTEELVKQLEELKKMGN